MDFSRIMRQGQRKFKTKDKHGHYGNCEYCGDRKLMFKYMDNKKELWDLCEICIDVFVEEEEL